MDTARPPWEYPWMRRLAPAMWLVLAAAVLLLAASPAQAITRAQAEQIALATLKPEALGTPVILFGLHKSVKAKAVVQDSGPSGTVLKRAGRGAAWLFWEDLMPGALYEHPSIALLVDDRTGRVVLKRPLGYYPLVDRKPPAFLVSDAAYYAPAYHVYSNVEAPEPARWQPRPVRAPAAVPPDSFPGDCILLVVMTPRKDWEASNAQAALDAWLRLGNSLGIPTYLPQPNGQPKQFAAGEAKPPSFEDQVSALDLTENVGTLSALGCRDIMIYIFGHGAAPPGWKPPPNQQVNASVQPGGPAAITLGVLNPKTEAGEPPSVPKKKKITPDDLVEMVEEVSGSTFKFVLESCHSERFKAALADEPNVLVTAFSSASNEVTFGYKIGGAVPQPAVPNPGLPQFSHGMTQGMLTAANDLLVGPTFLGQPGALAQLVKAGFDREKANDRAAAAARTTPSLATSIGPPLPPLFGGGVLRRFGGPGSNEVYADVGPFTTVPPGPMRRLLAVTITRFDVQLPGKRQVTNWLSPLGFSCSPVTRVETNDTLRCTGNLPLNTVVTANIRMSPGPSDAMGATVYVIADGAERGPFAMTGP
jgi:hypothetical protein